MGPLQDPTQQGQNPLLQQLIAQQPGGQMGAVGGPAGALASTQVVPGQIPWLTQLSNSMRGMAAGMQGQGLPAQQAGIGQPAQQGLLGGVKSGLMNMGAALQGKQPQGQANTPDWNSINRGLAKIFGLIKKGNTKPDSTQSDSNWGNNGVG